MERKFKLHILTNDMPDSSVDLIIDTFSKEPWIRGMEYHLDQFFFKADRQGLGIGSQFSSLISEDIKSQGSCPDLKYRKSV